MNPLLDAAGLALPDRLRTTDLQIQPQSLVALIGPNGSGKTSLLRALAGIDRASGTVRIAGEELKSLAPSRRRQLLSYLPASREMVWPIAVRDVIALGLDAPDNGRVDELASDLGLEKLARRPVDRLSTGERARVFLARALAPRPRVLLLDEPLSNLDPRWSLTILALLRDYVASGNSALVALHDLSLLDHFDRVVLMDEGAARVDATPQVARDAPEFELVFGVRPTPSGWALSPSADRRSSP